VEQPSTSTETAAATTSEPAGTGASAASGEATTATTKGGGMRAEAGMIWMVMGAVLSVVHSL
jgi:hypothetical protein